MVIEKRMPMKSCYIHIPFCKTICSYCDFCKFYYNKKWILKYLEQLQKEINLNYKGEKLSTIYIGGGTPTSLDYNELKYLLDIIKKLKLSNNYEYTIEANVETLDLDKIKLLKEYGINRVSIGVESIVEKNIKFLERHHTKEDVIKVIDLLKQEDINNINIDLIYALPKQRMDDLKIDLDFFLSLDIPHISTYSLMIEPHTKLFINNVKNIDETLDLEMYNYICKILKDNGYNHYEISNFSRDNFESKHNLTYWNNEEYYGFGVGASGYVNDIRYDNTRSINKYLDGNYRFSKEKIDFNTKVENEFILGFRKLKGINKKEFYDKYQIDIDSLDIIKKLKEEKKLFEDEDNIFINPKYIYTSNQILIEFLGENYEQRRNI